MAEVVETIGKYRRYFITLGPVGIQGEMMEELGELGVVATENWLKTGGVENRQPSTVKKAINLGPKGFRNRLSGV